MVTMTTDETRKVVDELVDTFKREGKFDRLRKDTLAKVLANDSFALITEETNQITDDVLKSLSNHTTKDKARATIREHLNVNLRQKIETAVFKVMGTDDNIQMILDEVGIPISSYLGLDDDDDTEKNNDVSKNENHQVCDMEIESDSDKGGDFHGKPPKDSNATCDNNQKIHQEAVTCGRESGREPRNGKDSRQEIDRTTGTKGISSGEAFDYMKRNEVTDEFGGNEALRMQALRKKKKPYGSTGSMEESLRRHRRPRRDPDFAYFN